ncbi:MAG: WYL domain-containing protein, partial [Bacteroidetes bacterium]|nr:WYL domain-containing protein [Fibrella sp.]
LTETGETFSGQNRLSLQTYLDRLQQMESLQEVIVWFDKCTARFAEGQRYWFGFVDEEERNDRVRMRFLTQSIDGVSRWPLMYGDSVTVESPDAVLVQIRMYIEELQAHYSCEIVPISLI